MPKHSSPRPSSLVRTFLQTGSVSTESQPQTKAYKALKAHASKAKSLRLAAIAATLRTGGHFDAVIAEIDKMMATLKAEEKDDIEQRDWCKEETFKNEQEASRYEYKIEKTVAKITKLTEVKEELEKLANIDGAVNYVDVRTVDCGDATVTCTWIITFTRVQEYDCTNGISAAYDTAVSTCTKMSEGDLAELVPTTAALTGNNATVHVVEQVKGVEIGRAHV